MSIAVNDIVKMSNRKLKDEAETPLWGGKFGKCIGIVKAINSLGDIALVQWNNGAEKAAYRISDLEVFSKTKLSPVRKVGKKKSDSFKMTIPPWMGK
jgi:hypothetical protein